MQLFDRFQKGDGEALVTSFSVQRWVQVMRKYSSISGRTSMVGSIWSAGAVDWIVHSYTQLSIICYK